MYLNQIFKISFCLVFLCYFSGLGTSVAQELVKLEYHIDEDLGAGNGIPINWTGTAENPSMEENLDLSSLGLEVGPHILIIRGLWRNTDGTEVWTLNNTRTFYIQEKIVPQVSNEPKKIVALEYFINDDKGVGQSQKEMLSEGSSIDETVELVVNDMPEGLSNMVFRVQDEDGNWSLGYGARVFVRSFGETQTASNIQKVEYYFGRVPTKEEDKDNSEHKIPTQFMNWDGEEFVGAENVPVLGQATPFDDFTPALSLTDIEIDIDSASTNLPVGRHYLYTRVQNENGDWSMTTPAVLDFCYPDPPETDFIISDLETEESVETFIRGREVKLDTVNTLYAQDFIYRIYEVGQENVLLTSLYQSAGNYEFVKGGNYLIELMAGTTCDSTKVQKSLQVLAPFPKENVEMDFSNIVEDGEKIMVWENLDLFFDHPEDLELSYSIAFEKNAEEHKRVEVSIENNNLYIKPKTDQYGDVTFIINATDTQGVTTPQTFSFNIDNINDMPVVETQIQRQDIIQWSTDNIIAEDLASHFADADGDKLSFTVVSDNPAVLGEVETYYTGSNNRQKFRLKVSSVKSFLGDAILTLTASDKNKWGEEEGYEIAVPILVRVQLLERPPERNSKAFPQFQLTDGVRDMLISNLDDYFYDPDGDDLYYEVYSDANEVSLSIQNQKELHVDVPYDFGGGITVTVIAYDRELGSPLARQVQATFDIDVSNINNSPFIEFTDTHTSICKSNQHSIDLRSVVRDDSTPDDDIIISASLLKTMPASIGESMNFSVTDEHVIQISRIPEENGSIFIHIEAIDGQGEKNVLDLTIKVVRRAELSVLPNGNLKVAEGEVVEWYRDGVKQTDELSNILKAPVKESLYKAKVVFSDCELFTDELYGNGKVLSVDDETRLNKEDIWIVPNPVNDYYFKVYSEGKWFGEYNVSLMDITGKEVYRGSINKTSYKLDHAVQLPVVSKGVYIFRLENQKERIVKKVIIR